VLQGVFVDLCPGSQLVQDLSAATALTTLSLRQISFESEPDFAAVLLKLPCLQVLCLLSLSVESESECAHASTASLSQNCPASPQQLWSLPYDKSLMRLTVAGMQFLCTLTSVRSLHLRSIRDITAAGLAALQNLRDLNSLNLEYIACDFSLSAVPALSQLTALTRLRLYQALDSPGAEFDPLVLTYMTHMKDLCLIDCVPTGGAAGAAELLLRLSQLPELETLALYCVDALNKVPPACTELCAEFSQLTPSSTLRSLTWSDPW